MKNRSPQGYWTSVFEQAKLMLNSNLACSPDDAFWMARHRIDQTQNLGDSGLFTAATVPADRDQPVLMLS